MTDWNRTQPTELDVHELSTHETWQLTSRMTSELAEEGLLPIDNRTWDGFSWDRVLTQKASEGDCHEGTWKADQYGVSTGRFETAFFRETEVGCPGP